MTANLAPIIDAAWDNRADLSTSTQGEVRDAVTETLAMLDAGKARVAEPGGQGGWKVNQWLKKAVLLSFRLNDNALIGGGPGASGHWWDKVPSKFDGWGEAEFKAAGIRAVPPAAVRRGAYIAPGAILMPSYVNLGAYVDEGTMVDTWGSIGSCAQIGKNCHISAGTGIGGVLEPLQANPTIIEDNCFIGARSEVVEGVIVREGSVLAWACSLASQRRFITAQQAKRRLVKCRHIRLLCRACCQAKTAAIVLLLLSS